MKRGQGAAPPPPLDLEPLERRRDHTLRRQLGRRVQGFVRAVRFIDEVGFATLFAHRTLNLPCLWIAVCGRRDPEFPQHTHRDPEVGLAWNLKDQLGASGRVFYAKLVQGKPTFVGLDLLPAVLRLRRSRRSYVQDYRDGHLSAAAKAILDALHRQHPQETFALKLAANLDRSAQRKTFDAAMTELQRRMDVAMCEARYDPTFTYVWDLVETRFPESILAARRLRPEAAAESVIRRYLDAVVYARPEQIRAVVGHACADAALARLARQNVVRLDQHIEGLGKKIVVHERG